MKIGDQEDKWDNLKKQLQNFTLINLNFLNVMKQI